MSRSWLAAVAAPLVLAGAAVDQSAPKPGKKGGGKPAAAIVDGAVGKALDEVILATDADDGGFCGVVVIGARGKVLLEKGYGIADAAASKEMPADALFDWASVSKQFTAAALLRLIDASRLDKAALKKLGATKLAASLDPRWRKLSLDDPLSRFFLPDSSDARATVTLRQLLNHTSGIEAGFKSEWQFDGRSRDSLVDCVLSRPMTAKPGEKWEYSNSGYALVAAVIELVSGRPFEEFCAEHLFAPAGLPSATMIGRPELDLARVPKIARGAGFTDRPKEFAFAYGNELTWGYRGCGGVVASVHDLFLWDRALRGDTLLSKEARAELYRPGLNDYALGWQVKQTGNGTRAEHGGGVLGVATYFLRHLEKDYVVALACSYEPKTHPAALAEQLARTLERELR